jgi:hypothetical protein
VTGQAWCKDVSIPQTSTASIFKAQGSGGGGTWQQTLMDLTNFRLGVQLVLPTTM